MINKGKTAKVQRIGSCLGCGDPFKSKGKGSRQVYCSRACRWRAWAKKNPMVRLGPGEKVLDVLGNVMVKVDWTGKVVKGNSRVIMAGNEIPGGE